MRFRWIAAIAATVATALVATACGDDSADSASSEGEHTESSYYLSLGDSLTVGVQPDDNGTPQETGDGYTDVLHRTLYDSDSTLQHERMGCGGEDTTTFLEGGIPQCESKYERRAQMEAAENFLIENESRVDLVTLTIGGNNFTRCVDVDDIDLEGDDDLTLDVECVDEGLELIETEVPAIAERLREAAGPDVQIIGMTYYNPFLAALLLEDEDEPADEVTDDETPEGAGEVEGDLPEGQSLVEYTTEVLQEMNQTLRDTYEASGIDVADVEDLFDSDDFEVPADSDTGMPTNLQAICDLTWMCDTDVGPDIHTNQAGAQEIAALFEERVR